MLSDLTAFLSREYLDGYIKAGGSKVKLVVAADGERVEEIAGQMVAEAQRRGYVTAHLDANKIQKVNILGNIYQAAVRHHDIIDLVDNYCGKVIGELGYDPAAVPPCCTFVKWAHEIRGRDKTEICRDVKEILEKELYRNGSINRSFATVVLQLASSRLGVRENEFDSEELDLLCNWIRGVETLSLKDVRRYHVFTKINRYNARMMLRSLVELTRLGGKEGLLLVVSGLEVLLARKDNGRLLYSKTAREEFYESIRQLIDEIDSLHYLLVILGFRKELVDDKDAGLMSYMALWLRIANEIAGSGVNLFRDFLNLEEVENGMRPSLGGDLQ